MTKFSANLGFLWNDIPLPDAIRAAKAAGFDAVECHWPYDTPVEDVASALTETKFEMLGINTIRGDVASGENGLSALPNRVRDATAAIDQSIAYAAAIKCKSVHVMAGKSEGPEAQHCFVENLRYACEQAAPHGIKILIEPLNRYDVPGYFLQTTAHAIAIIQEVGTPNIKLMFDCYHVYLMEGHLSYRIEKLMPHIGHIQFAGAPGRRAPDTGEVAYDAIFNAIERLGYTQPLGAEYLTDGKTEQTLAWLKDRR